MCFGMRTALRIYSCCSFRPTLNCKGFRILSPGSAARYRNKKKMSSFCKNDKCPSSQRLLAFQIGDVGKTEARAIGAHLISCEFCEAEAVLYSQYPPVDETVETAQMPKPLFELAAALLCKNRGEIRFSGDIGCLYEDIN